MKLFIFPRLHRWLFQSAFFIPMIAVLTGTPPLHAACPAPLAATTGEHVWQIADRIQAAVCGPRTFMIAQSDIPLTISTPGVYCVVEELEYDPGAGVSGVGIDVTTNRVRILFNGHSLRVANDGLATRTGIRFDNASFVKVENGLIRLTNSGGGVGATIVGIDAINSSNHIEIDTMTVTGLEGLPASTFDGVGFRANGAENVLITNSNFRNLHRGTDLLNSAQFVTFRSVEVDGADTGMFFDSVDNVALYDCISRNTNDHGYEIDNGSTNYLLHNCLANQIGLDGFHLSLTGVASNCCIFFDYCKAIDIERHGFFVENTTNPVLDRCTTLRTGADGIRFTANTTDGIIRNCNVEFPQEALLGTAGIFLDTMVDNCTVQSCIVKDSSNGFGIDDTGTNNRIYNNAAQNNAGGNYSGVAAALIATGNASIAAANFWMNVEP